MTIQHYKLPHHFTASALVLAPGHILLVNHKRIGGWVPPGGHIEEDELPEETVVREVAEETGVIVEIISTPVPQTGDAEAFFLASPLYVQSVLAIEKGERFYHIDLAYLCRPVLQPAKGGQLPPVRSNSEVKEACWVPLSEIESLSLAKNVKEALEYVEQRQEISLWQSFELSG